MINLGDIYTSNEGCEFEVVDYQTANSIGIYFKETDHYRKAKASNILAGNIKNPFHKSVYDVGFVGIGPHKVSVNKKNTVEYLYWFRSMRRCYDEGSTEYPYYGMKGVYISPQWHNFQEFAEWCQWQRGFKQDGWALDKDLFSSGDEKYYGPDTCCFLPREVNNLLRSQYSKGYNSRLQVFVAAKYIRTAKSESEASQIYKESRKLFIKEKAKKYRDILCPRVYEGLLNYV